MSDPTTEKADIIRSMSAAIRRMNAELYYFGLTAVPPRPTREVVDRLVTWRRGDPKEWSQRMFKPNIPKV